jgi:TIR domain
VSGYEFDVFLSYSRKGGSPGWVHNHFFPRLRDCLTDEIGYVPNIFIDYQMDPGTVWTADLERSIGRSKILVSVYSPQYFRSDWCVAEWKSMAAREDLLGLASTDLTQGLIVPVLYSDSANFPEYGRDRMWHDMKGLDSPDPMFQQTPDWLHFHKKMRGIAANLAELLAMVPDWQPGWPIVSPDVPIPPTTSFPRW